MESFAVEGLGRTAAWTKRSGHSAEFVNEVPNALSPVFKFQPDMTGGDDVAIQSDKSADRTLIL